MTESNKVRIDTNKGEIVILLYPEHTPETVANFKSYVNQGLYDGIIFHRVEENFIVQTGDPLTKDPKQQNLWGTGSVDHQLLGESEKRTPTGRLTTPDDVANVALYLCSSFSDQIQGQTIVIDGGYSILA